MDIFDGQWELIKIKSYEVYEKKMTCNFFFFLFNVVTQIWNNIEFQKKIALHLIKNG